MKALIDLLTNHGTKVLGYAQGIVAALAAVPGLIDPKQLPYWMALLAVLTVLRGHSSPAQPQVKQ